MAHPPPHDPQVAVTDALAALREAVERCRPLLAEPGSELAPAMLGAASMTSEITVILLQLSVPSADDHEPGTERRSNAPPISRPTPVATWSPACI